MHKYVIWDDNEAFIKQSESQGPSSCGVMAVFDLLTMLNAAQSPEIVNLKARIRNYDAGLKEYLESRMRSGTTHLNLMQAVSEGAKGSVKSAFFSIPPLMTGPELFSHLGRWIEEGAVPLLTLNLFLQGRDAWHHHVVRGVDEKSKVLLLNLIERVEAHQIPLLSPPSFMIIPKEDMQR
jgi:hypothetical protein